MANLWDGTTSRAVHANGATPVVKTASEVLNWANVNGGTNSLSAYYELDARAASVSIRIDANPGAAHNGRKLKIAVNREDTSQTNFRGVIFTGGSPVERGSLTASNIYMLDRRAGHLVIEIVNGRARINTGASMNDDPPLPSNADMLAILNGWTTGATWADIGGGEARVQFTTNGVFNPTRALIARVLGVAGAGAGNRDHAGGGGGGFASDNPAFSITAASHAITIGVGGIAPTSGTTTPANASGGNTSIGALFTWQGGGAGGGRVTQTSGNGAPPASGGPGGGGAGAGAGATAGTNPRGAAAGSQGFAGGNGNNLASNAGHGGGGGGAGGAGGNSTASSSGGAADGKSGDGGIGIQSDITGTNIGYGGGAPGGRWADGTAAANYGTNAPGGVNYGAGEAEGSSTNANQNGAANRGGGGGGGGDGGKAGGNGGTGFVVIRVPLTVSIGL